MKKFKAIALILPITSLLTVIGFLLFSNSDQDLASFADIGEKTPIDSKSVAPVSQIDLASIQSPLTVKEIKKLEVFSQLVKNDPSKPDHIEKIQSIAPQYAPIMCRLISQDPQKAYDYAVPSEKWAKLPLDIQPLVARQFSERGAYVTYVTCESRELHKSIRTKSVDTSIVSNTKAVDAIKVSGKGAGRNDRVISAMWEGVAFEEYAGLVMGEEPVAGFDESEASSGAAYPYSYRPLQFDKPPSTGACKVLYLITKFSDDTDYPATIGQAEYSLVRAKNLYTSYSYEQLMLDYTVVQIEVTALSSASNMTILEETAQVAFEMGYNPDDYDLIMRRTKVRGNFAFLNTKDSFLRRDNATTTVHEIGHNFGLHHANYWKVDNGEPAWSQNGVNVIYGEDFDAMSNGPRGDFNAWEKVSLDWLTLEDGDYAEDVTDGIYRIYPYDSHGGNFNTTEVDGAHYFVTVFKDTEANNETPQGGEIREGADREYVISVRNQPGKGDSPNPWFSEGIILHWKPWTREGSLGYDITGNFGAFGTSLVDVNPKSNTSGQLGQWKPESNTKEQYDSVVLIGQTYIDTDPDNRDGNLYFTPLRKTDPDGIPRSGDEYVDVKIVRGDQTGNQAPSADWNLSATSVAPGEPIIATVTAVDGDDAKLGYFWDFGLGTDGDARRAMPLDGNPTQTFSYDRDGIYTLSCIVTDGRGQTVTLSQTIIVSDGSVIPPAPPSGLAATVTGGMNVDLSWMDNSNNERGFVVQRSTTNGSGFMTVGAMAADMTSYRDSGLSLATNYFYRVIATNSSGESVSDEVMVTTWTPAESWRSQYFGDRANTGDAADDNDFDGDSVSNILERAFGTIPNDGSSFNLPRDGMVNVGDSDYLSITYRRLRGGNGITGVNYTAEGLMYALEYDSDLIDPWSKGSVVQVGNATDNGDGTETVTVRVMTEVGAQTKQFIRLNIKDITALP